MIFFWSEYEYHHTRLKYYKSKRSRASVLVLVKKRKFFDFFHYFRWNCVIYSALNEKIRLISITLFRDGWISLHSFFTNKIAIDYKIWYTNTPWVVFDSVLVVQPTYEAGLVMSEGKSHSLRKKIWWTNKFNIFRLCMLQYCVDIMREKEI